MQIDDSVTRKMHSKDFTDAMIRIGLVAFLVVMCARVFAPFVSLILWALILAIALYPLHQKLTKLLGDRPGRAATLMVVTGLLLIGIPMVLLGSSFAGHVHDTYTAFKNNTLSITQPSPSVADWPLVGERVYAFWNEAANNLPGLIKNNQEQLKSLSERAVSSAANTASSVLLFLAALIVSGIMMAYGESGTQNILRIFNRLAGADKGAKLQKLCTATVRSVATGVIGVAFIQALLLGVGFILADIPAAGVLAVVVMLLGIVQLPAALISLPAIAYLWWSGDASTTSNVIYTVYLLIAGLADNVLKPLLLGRGVDAPMPVVLLGALGGMVTSGIIGMFIGAVLLSVGYQLFMQWVANADSGSGDQEIADGSDVATAISRDESV